MESWMKPMLCTAVDDVPVGEYVMEPKFDGWRLLMHSTGRGCLTFAGRDGSDYTGKLKYIERELTACLPPDTCVDGEIIGASRSDVQSIFFGGGEHIPTQGVPPLTYVVFDILRCNGQDVRDLPWHERRALLEAATFTQHVRLTDLHPCNKRTYQVAVATGFEGVVCKLKSSRYVSGGRGHSWLKIKAEWTVEARVDGWEVGKGSHAARMGALRCTLLDDNDRPQIGPDGKPIQIRVGGGFTDAQREDVAQTYPTNWEYKVIEVKHNGVTENGKVLAPNFVCRRDDRTVGPPIRKPRMPAQPPRTPAAGSWVRNYGAMGAPKLIGALADFARGHGDAVDRVNAKQGDLALNIARAKEAARTKGVPIPPGL